MRQKIMALFIGLCWFASVSYTQQTKTEFKPVLAVETLKEIKSSGILISPEEMTKIIFEEITNSSDYEIIFLKPDYTNDDLKNVDILINGTYEIEGNLVTLDYQVNLVQTKTRTKMKANRIELLEIKKEVLANLADIFATITIQSTPDSCDVEIDGIFLGQTPLVVKKIIIGSHLLHLTHPGYFGLFQEVDVTNNQILNLTLTSQQSNEASKPMPVGGIDAIIKKIVYPEEFKRTGVKGDILVVVKVSAQGEVLETQVKKSLGNQGLDAAVVTAIKAIKWEPARLGDQSVESSTQIRIQFSQK
ncbi:TonB family protein [candidate division KSB1 bacterium]|nr:TonB family protein [candidate division KSB1 bacterium]